MPAERFLIHCDHLARSCPGVRGVVLADADGLVIASWGDLAGDAAAAAATQLIRSADQHLSLIERTEVNDMLVWSTDAVWYVTRHASNHTLLVHATAGCRVGALRIAATPLLQTLFNEARGNA